MSDPFMVVIGMGADGPGGLAGEALDHIATARILAGGRRHLAFFEGWVGETILIDADVDQLIRRLREVYLREKTVVLASGDPLFHGIGRALLKAFPREELDFCPICRRSSLHSRGSRRPGTMPGSSACTAAR